MKFFAFKPKVKTVAEKFSYIAFALEFLSNYGDHQSVPVCNFVSRSYYYYNVLLQKSGAFSLEILTN